MIQPSITSHFYKVDKFRSVGELIGCQKEWAFPQDNELDYNKYFVGISQFGCLTSKVCF